MSGQNTDSIQEQTQVHMINESLQTSEEQKRIVQRMLLRRVVLEKNIELYPNPISK